MKHVKNWEAALVQPELSLEEAIMVLDKASLRIVMVVDAQRKLLGTLTDGDVRRALLGHKSLTLPVHEVMCKTPSVAQKHWLRDQVLAVMEAKQLLQLPIVNEQGQVVGLHTLHELLDKPRLDNPVFLMAGGFGTRLHPLTNDCPKPLLKVGGKPILEIILESCLEAGFHRFYISTHYLPHMIREYFGDGSKWGCSITYVHEQEPLGTGGALGLLPHEDIDLPMLMMNGDLLTRVNYAGLLDFHEEHGGIATMCVRDYEYKVPYGVITNDGAKITGMVEKPVQRFFINAGIYLLSPQLVHQVKQGVRIDMPTLLQAQIDAGREVAMFPVHEYWLDIGRMEDFQKAQKEIEGL